ncbi:MAG: DNA-binding protein [Thermoprotei archaeon]|nr:MAG: DNA-binding protein [Thermoprotei archaeon]
MESRTPILMIGKKNIRSYVLDIVMLFNQGMDKVIIVGRGPSINKAVNVYNALKARLGDALQLDGVEIGSEVRGHRLVSFIKITISRK